MEQYPRLPMNSPVDRLQKAVDLTPCQSCELGFLLQLSCCGVDSYADWFETSYGRALSQVPESCCKRLLNHTCARVELKDNLPTDINIHVRMLF